MTTVNGAFLICLAPLFSMCLAYAVFEFLGEFIVLTSSKFKIFIWNMFFIFILHGNPFTFLRLFLTHSSVWLLFDFEHRFSHLTQCVVKISVSLLRKFFVYQDWVSIQELGTGSVLETNWNGDKTNSSYENNKYSLRIWYTGKQVYIILSSSNNFFCYCAYKI